MKFKFVFISFIACVFSNTAQSQYVNLPADLTNRTSLTGNLHSDFITQSNNIDGLDDSNNDGKIVKENKYSPLAAGLLSGVLPGAGQFYTKSYWQSAAFFGAEIISWVVYATVENKGDQQTDIFQKYANEHWSVARYAGWVNLNFSKSININSDQSLNPWQRVNWSELNNTEEQIAAITNSGFSHILAPYNDQQYYEMIGKYSQYGGGWDDAATFQAGGFTRADIIANNGIGNVSPKFLEYRDMRDKANSYYNIAKTVSYVIVANHIFSALEAALNTSKINHKIQLQGHIQSRRIYGNLVEFAPTFQVKYEL